MYNLKLRLILAFQQMLKIIYTNLFTVSRWVFGQVSPVCAIVGSEVAAEIIKAVTKKDPPHNNLFFFSPMEDCAGFVQCIGA